MIYYISNRPNQEHIDSKRIDMSQVRLGKITGLDIETTGLDFKKNKTLMVLLGDKENQYVIDFCSVDKEQLKKLFSKVDVFVGHNLGFDLPFLIEEGFSFKTSQVFCTMVTEQSLIKGTKHSASLKNTVKRRLGTDTFDKGITKEFIKMSARDPLFENRHIKYGAEDIEYLLDLREEQIKQITRYKMNDLMDANNKMVVVASYMKTTGMPLCKESWMKLYYENLNRADEIELELDEELRKLGLKQRPRNKKRIIQTDIFGGGSDVVNDNKNNVNYNSSEQVKNIFIALKQPIPKVNKKNVITGEREEKDTVGAPELEEYLILKPKSILRPFINKLIEYKTYKKRTSTYGKKFLDDHYFEETGRIYPTFKVNSTENGRMSSSSPNAQNIPRLDSFRECFRVPTSSNNKIWTCDLGSAELRIWASLAKDEKMLALYASGEDLHSYLATPVYNYLNNTDGVVISKKTHPEFRNTMKTVNFGVPYGASGAKIGKVLNVSKEKGTKVMSILRSTIPDAFEFLDVQKETGQNVGILVFDDVWNQHKFVEEVLKNMPISAQRNGAIGRESMNARLQGVNGQMMKLALIRVFEYIYENKLKSRIISAVHDEMVIEIYSGEEAHCEAFKQIMVDSGNYFLTNIVMEVEDNLSICWNK